MVFFYVLPQKPWILIILMVPKSLQMVWIKYPHYFCTTSENGREVSEQYVKTAIGLLPTHKFQ